MIAYRARSIRTDPPSGYARAATLDAERSRGQSVDLLAPPSGRLALLGEGHRRFDEVLNEQLGGLRAVSLHRRGGYIDSVISRYVQEALRRARYRMLDDGTFCGTVANLRGVVASAHTLEQCRDQLAEIVEEWVLVRVSRGLSVPTLGGETVRVRKAS